MRTEKLVILIMLAGLSTAVFSMVTSFTMPTVAQDHGSFKGPAAISDGDTLHYSFRIFGIDTPEKRQN